MTEPTAVKDNRISAPLARQSILADFCRQYLAVHDEITDYNKEVLAEKDSEWTVGKVLEKARDLGRPTDSNVEPNVEVRDAIKAYEDAVNALAHSRKAVLDVTSKALGITLSATAERNPEMEAPLKEKRKLAVEIGTQLGMIAKMITDEKAKAAVTEFLATNPLPAVGREQVRTFGESEKTTPKYRVTVQVFDQDGTEKVNESGFTKASLALTKYYERGKAPKQDVLRAAWEKAGNTPDNTVTNPVEFDDNNLHFVITKK